MDGIIARACACTRTDVSVFIDALRGPLSVCKWQVEGGRSAPAHGGCLEQEGVCLCFYEKVRVCASIKRWLFLPRAHHEMNSFSFPIPLFRML